MHGIFCETPSYFMKSDGESPLDGGDKCQNAGYFPNYWVAVKELSLSYKIGGTILSAIYIQYGS